MSLQDRKTAIMVAVVGAVAVITAAVITSGRGNRSVEQPRAENKAETKGGQSPAVVGAKDVTVTYGEKTAKKLTEKPK